MPTICSMRRYELRCHLHPFGRTLLSRDRVRSVPVLEMAVRVRELEAVGFGQDLHCVAVYFSHVIVKSCSHLSLNQLMICRPHFLLQAAMTGP